MPHFLRHYDFVDRIVVYDNQSDDGSLEILKSNPKVEVRSFDTGGKHHTGKLDQIRNEAWMESKGKADYVIVCDTDEFLYHPKLDELLELMKESRATLLKPQGYEMLGERPPEAGENIRDLYTRGVRTYSFDKCVLFDPNAIEKIGYQPGSHVCEPEGRVVLLRRPGLFLLHYRHLGVEFVRKRYEACVERRSDYNREKHFGTHYLESEENTRRRFEKMEQDAVDVFSRADPTLDMSDHLDEMMKKAGQCLADKNWEQAVSELESVLGYEPGNAPALEKLSVALRNTGRLMDAGHALKQAVALDPSRPVLWFNLGEIAADLGSEKVAIHSYQKALSLRPDFFLARVRLADAYKQFNHLSEAEDQYRQAIREQPERPLPYRSLGNLLYKAKRYEEAREVYEIWLNNQEGNASAYNGLGLVYQALGQKDEALRSFRSALERAPSSLAILNNLGTLLHVSGQVEEGLVYFQKALELDPCNPVIKTHLANALIDLGRDSEAAELNPVLAKDRKQGMEEG